ncbi:MAG: F0F1 ATP synthase subunit [Ignavibacteriales bacterium CG_4_9_14_3_um_filter_30_11]|nr:MAG: F0F1 ATP synthase subunit [Ignavibacteriales bacterium CG_4_9_14_3_um_filter_30_11]
MKEQDEHPKDDNNLRSIGNYLGLGMQLAATVGAMVFLGYWLDGKFKTSPWLILIFSFLGIASGLYNFLRTVIQPPKK